jgi:hypothetical protein
MDSTQHNKICPKCGAENEPQFAFCKQCGAAFVSGGQAGFQQQAYYNQPPVPQQSLYGAGAGYSGNGPQYTPYRAAPSTIEDVPVGDVIEFVGPKADVFVPKFQRMAASGSKTGFNPIVFFLSLFVSPIVGTFWMFHRKMKKTAIIFLTIALILFAGQTVCGIKAMDSVTKALDSMASEQFLEDAANGNQQAITQNIMNIYFDDDMMTCYAVSSLIGLCNLALTIVMGVKANYYYKNFVLSSIRAVDRSDEAAYHAELRRRGGTSSVVWVILLILTIAVWIAIAFVAMRQIMPSMINFINSMMQYRQTL